MVVLVGMSGSGKGQKYPIEKDQVTLGRRPDNDIPVDDSSASGSHSVIIRDGARYTLRDLGSTNGTFLNGERVQESRLRPKDIIQIGSAEYLFDGQGIEVEVRENGIPPTVELTPGAIPAAPQGVPDSFQSASPFGRHRDYRRFWFGMIVVVGVLTVLALGYFLYALFGW